MQIKKKKIKIKYVITARFGNKNTEKEEKGKEL